MNARIRTLVAGATVLALGLGAGIAVGAAQTPDVPVPAGPYETQADCPGTAAAIEELTGTRYDFFAPSCPGVEEVRRLHRQSSPTAEFVAACEKALAIEPDSACRGVVERAESDGTRSAAR